MQTTLPIPSVKEKRECQVGDEDIGEQMLRTQHVDVRDFPGLLVRITSQLTHPPSLLV